MKSQLLRLMLGKWDPETAEAPSPEQAGSSVSAEAWLNSASMLQRRKPEDALDWARRLAGARGVLKSNQPSKRNNGSAAVLSGKVCLVHLYLQDTGAAWTPADRAAVRRRVALGKTGVEVPDILLMLGNDGCEEGDLPAEDGWPVVNHFATAELKYALGVNSTDAGLDDEVTGCFGDLVANYLHD